MALSQDLFMLLFNCVVYLGNLFVIDILKAEVILVILKRILPDHHVLAIERPVGGGLLVDGVGLIDPIIDVLFAQSAHGR